MSEELKPCPRCGAPGKELGGPTPIHRQYITGCSMQDKRGTAGGNHGTGAGRTQAEANQNWNRRAADERVRELVGALKSLPRWTVMETKIRVTDGYGHITEVRGHWEESICLFSDIAAILRKHGKEPA